MKAGCVCRVQCSEGGAEFVWPSSAWLCKVCLHDNALLYKSWKDPAVVRLDSKSYMELPSRIAPLLGAIQSDSIYQDHISFLTARNTLASGYGLHSLTCYGPSCSVAGPSVRPAFLPGCYSVHFNKRFSVYCIRRVCRASGHFVVVHLRRLELLVAEKRAHRIVDFENHNNLRTLFVCGISKRTISSIASCWRICSFVSSSRQWLYCSLYLQLSGAASVGTFHEVTVAQT